MSKLLPAVFIDRDGVIIENRADYVKDWNEVEFIPGALEALKRLSRSPYRLVLVTNQSAVGRGIITLEDANRIGEAIVVEIEAAGGRIDGYYMCPHSPDEHCECRKPAPGMLLEASKDLSIDLRGSFLIGDARCDLEAAWAVRACAILVLTGRGCQEAGLIAPAIGQDYLVVDDLSQAVEHVLCAAESQGKGAGMHSV